jgi:hypothetical protein
MYTELRFLLFVAGCDPEHIVILEGYIGHNGCKPPPRDEDIGVIQNECRLVLYFSTSPSIGVLHDKGGECPGY